MTRHTMKSSRMAAPSPVVCVRLAQFQRDASEVEAHHELEYAAAGVVGVLQIAIGARGLSEGGIHRQTGGNSVAGREQQEVGQVEGIECLRAKLDIGPLADLGLLDQAEVPLLLPGSV